MMFSATKISFITSSFCLLFALAAWGASPPAGKACTNSIGMEFVLIPAGRFTRTGVENDFGEQTVIISKPF
jgi:formylglycine-generating enzyme required for sulfatase activity